MLDQLRANKGGIITYVFLFAIIIVFVVSFGPGSFDKGCNASRAPAWAAKVNGQEVGAAEYEQSYANLLRNFQAQAGPSFSRELAEQLGLPRMAMNQVVDRTLLLQEARRQGLTVSFEELARTIAALPGFQTAGTFDKEGYQRAVAAAYGSADRFERRVREDLLVQRLEAGLRETVKMPEAEVKEAWTADHDRVSVRFVRFPLAAAEAEVNKPSAAEAAAFAVKASARIEQAYREGAARFDQPRKVHVRHLLAKAAGPAADAAAKKKLEALAARLAKGEDFAKVAKEASEDESTRDRGGDLGFVGEGLVEKPFADAAFALAAGQVSAPVRTGAGWHLIKVEEQVPAKKVTLAEARAVLAPELLVKDRAAALATEKAAAALKGLQAGKTLDALFPAEEAGAKGRKVAVKLGGQALLPESTGPVTGPGPFVARLGAAPELLKAALAASGPQVLGQVFQTPQGPVVAVVESRERPDPSQYGAQREQVVRRLSAEREAAAQQAWVKKLRDAADIKVNPAMTSGTAPVDPG